LVNLELVCIDTIIGCSDVFRSLIENEYPNIGNILMCYSSQNLSLKIIKNLVPIIQGNLDKVKIKNFNKNLIHIF